MKNRRSGLRIFFFILSLLALCAVGAASILLDRSSTRRALESGTFTEPQTSVSRSSVMTIGGKKFRYENTPDTFLFVMEDKSMAEDGAGGLADYILLFSIDQTSKAYSLVEVPPDIMTDLEGDGSLTQICNATLGAESTEEGCRKLKDAVSGLLSGLQIGGWFEIDMEKIPDLNSLLGGVTVTLAEDLTDTDPAFEQGATVTLTDRQAYAYLTAEGASPQSRTKRQTDYLNSFLHEGVNRVLEDEKYFYTIFSSIRKLGSTDMQNGAFVLIGQAMTEYTMRGVLSLDAEAADETDVLADGRQHQRLTVDQDSLIRVLGAVCSLTEVESETEALPDGKGEGEIGADALSEPQSSSESIRESVQKGSLQQSESTSGQEEPAPEVAGVIVSGSGPGADGGGVHSGQIGSGSGSGQIISGVQKAAGADS